MGRLLERMSDRLDASAALLFMPDTERPALLAQQNIIPGRMAEYVEYFHRNRQQSRGEQELAGRALRVHDLMDEAQFRKSEFFNDLLCRHAIADVLSSIIVDSPPAPSPAALCAATLPRSGRGVEPPAAC